MEFLLRLLTAAGLAADAWVHWLFAPDMALIKGPYFTAADLFKAQAVLAAVAGVLVLVWARRWTYAIAFLVAASAVGALVLYKFVDVGPIGPIPNMYDPSWFQEKTISLVGEGIATLTALIGFFVVRKRRDTTAPTDTRVA